MDIMKLQTRKTKNKNKKKGGQSTGNRITFTLFRQKM
jgi:hypothetical protein